MHCVFVSLCVQSSSIALAAHYMDFSEAAAIGKSQRWSARSMSFKHSCCVLFAVPAATEEIVPAIARL